MRKDRALSIGMLVFSIIMYMETFNFAKKSKLQIAGPEVYPRLVLAVIVLFALILLIQSFFTKVKHSPAFEWRSFLDRYGKIILLFLFFGIYVFLLPKMSFIIATLIFMFASQALLMGLKKRNPIIINICVTSVSTLLIYFVFTDFLNIWLP